jgi:hypothetical protein
MSPPTPAAATFATGSLSVTASRRIVEFGKMFRRFRGQHPHRLCRRRRCQADRRPPAGNRGVSPISCSRVDGSGAPASQHRSRHDFSRNQTPRHPGGIRAPTSSASRCFGTRHIARRWSSTASRVAPARTVQVGDDKAPAPSRARSSSRRGRRRPTRR